MTSTETSTELDPRTVFGRAHATARTVLDGVGADQFEAPTPCPEFDVRALAGHLLAVAQRVRNVGRGESPFSVPEVVEGVADDGWVAAWDAGRRRGQPRPGPTTPPWNEWSSCPGPRCPARRP